MNQLADGYGSRVIAKDICGVLTQVLVGHKKRPDEKDDTVDNNETKDNTLDGILVEYNQDEIALFNYLGDIWVGTE